MIHNNIEKENWGKFDEGEGISLERKKIIIDILVTFVLHRRLKNFWTKNRTEEEEEEEGKKKLRKYLLASLEETIRVSIVETGLNIYAHLRIYGRNAFSKLLFPIYTVIQMLRI